MLDITKGYLITVKHVAPHLSDLISTSNSPSLLIDHFYTKALATYMIHLHYINLNKGPSVFRLYEGEGKVFLRVWHIELGSLVHNS